MTRTRILLADDHTLLLEAFKSLLEPEYDVVGTVSDGQALLTSAQELKPDLIIIDIGMPQISGIEAARRIRQSFPKAKLIFLTMNHDSEVAAEAFRIGASGFLVKTSAASELVRAIREILRGGSYVTSGILKSTVSSVRRKPRPKKDVHELTKRQREVVKLLGEGRSMKEAALILKLTPRTIAFHKYRTMEQLHVKSNAELVQYAVEHGIVSPRVDH